MKSVFDLSWYTTIIFNDVYLEFSIIVITIKC